MRPLGTATQTTARIRKASEDQDQVGGRAGQGGQVVVADDLAEVAGDDRGGLGPAYQEAAEEREADKRAEDDERGKEQGADGVHVVHGVEGDAALQAGGLVAEARGHPGMGALVNTERKQQQNEFKDGNEKGAGLQAESPESRVSGARSLRMDVEGWKTQVSMVRAVQMRSVGKVPTDSPAATFWPASTMAWLAMRALAPMVVGTRRDFVVAGRIVGVREDAREGADHGACRRCRCRRGR